MSTGEQHIRNNHADKGNVVISKAPNGEACLRSNARCVQIDDSVIELRLVVTKS